MPIAVALIVLLVQRVHLPAFLALMATVVVYGIAADMTFQSIGKAFGLGFATALEQVGLLVVAGALASTVLLRAPLGTGTSALAGALAGLGGAMWGLYQETVTAAIGAQVAVLVFIVIIIGGLGSVGGCFVGALLVGLTANYIGFLAPKVALGSNILLMALILLWRPQGLYPVAKR